MRFRFTGSTGDLPNGSGAPPTDFARKGTSMSNWMRNFWREDDGMEMVEWAIVGALITTAGAAVFTSLGDEVTTTITRIIALLAAA